MFFPKLFAKCSSHHSFIHRFWRLFWGLADPPEQFERSLLFKHECTGEHDCCLCKLAVCMLPAATPMSSNGTPRACPEQLLT